jgi:putative FmdB family regulatory protein
MPMYEYRCDSCEESFDRIVSADERDDVTCPFCDELAERPHDIEGGNAIKYNTDGFYTTDYKGDNHE